MNQRVLAPRPTPDTYGRRLKTIKVPPSTLQYLFTMNGESAVKMTGWPNGARLVGMRVPSNEAILYLYIFHPDFPIVPATKDPPEIEIKAEFRG